MTLIDRLNRWAEQMPEQTAFGFYSGDNERLDASYTYTALRRDAQIVAEDLVQRGLRGERALLLYPPGLEFVAALFGCFAAGVIAVPAYPPRRNRNRERVRAIAENAQAAVVLTADGVIERETLPDDAPFLRQLPWLATNRLACESASGTGGAQLPTVATEDVALLQYTSGSTGVPKGVMLTHANLLHNCKLITHGFEPCPQTGAGLFWLPTYHDMGLVGGVLEPVFLGRPSVLLSPLAFLQKPIRWLRGISRFRVTMSGGPNFAYALCNEKITDEQCEGLDLSSWDVAFNGAEPVRAETLEAFTRKFAPYGFHAEAHYPCYGMAETTLIVAGGSKRRPPTVWAFDAQALEQHRAAVADHRRAEDDGSRNGNASDSQDSGGDAGIRRLVSCGPPLLDTQVRIVSPHDNRPLPEGHVGEIWISSPSVARGYWNNRDETRQVFAAELDDEPGRRYLRTGDLGFLHGGELFITGRRKDLIIIRGRNVYPHDVERTVESVHPALRLGGGACFSVEADGEEQLVVVQELERQHRGTDGDELIEAIRVAVLEEHEVSPREIVLLKSGRLPKTSSGKVQRSACREAYLRGELKAVARRMNASRDAIANGNGKRVVRDANGSSSAMQRPAAAEIRDWLVERIAARLRRPAGEVDIHEPFARFGLDSLAAVQTSGELAEFLGQSVSPTVLYSYPTIAELAAHLAGSAASPDGESSREDAAHRRTAEPIAIVGLACRFPGAGDPESFWTLLREGRDEVRDVPEGRWDVDSLYDRDPDAAGKMVTRHGAFLDGVDLFDPQFFGIAPREAASIDPQQRLLLEVAWETLENAGIAADRVAGSQVGVFVGIGNCDYARLQAARGGLQAVDAYSGTGTASSVAAGRLGHVLGVHGPCLAVDTACSSSLAAVHLAVQSLRGGECRAALAGGVNLILDPASSVALSRLKALSSDGRCKAFDAAADGYGRGEGCGLVLLKRLEDALQDGDRIWAVVRGSAVNHDGRSSGLTAPHGPSQEAVLRAALENAGVTAGEVAYVEAHGTGTELGDPIEMEALTNVLCGDRGDAQPLMVGSVKTNIGHLEAAGGIAGLIKTVLSLRHGEIPSMLHLANPNPYIPWDTLPVEVLTRLTPWPDGRRRIAGVSSFGFSGTNVYVVLEESPDWASTSWPRLPASAVERSGHVLALSAKDDAALNELAKRYADYLSTQPLDHQKPQAFADVCHTAACGRSHFAHRLAIVAENAEQAREKLLTLQSGSLPAAAARGRAGSRRPKIAMLFTGQGAQYAGMGRELYATQPTFRRALDRCNEVLRDVLPRPLLDVLHAGDGADSPLDQTLYTQPALFALEHALCELWRAWGVEPDLLLGHSVGEYVAACVAGVFSLEDALKLVAARGRLMQTLTKPGEMTAVAAGEDAVRERLSEVFGDIEDHECDDEGDELCGSVEIAAVNGPRQTVISGPAAAMRKAAAALEAEGMQTTPLAVSHAFHSRLMEPMLDEFERVCGEVRFTPPQRAIVSNVHGRLAGAELATPDYWRQQIRRTMRFADGMAALDAAGAEVYLEIGPRPLLLAAGRQCLAERDRDRLWLASLRTGRGDWPQMLESVAELYARGVDIDWPRFDADYPRHKVMLPKLPNYPFQRSRYWFDDGNAAAVGDSPSAPIARPRMKSSASDSGESIHDWLFEVEWQPRSRPDQRLPRSPADFIPPPSDIRESVRPEAERVVEQLHLPRYRELSSALDRLSAAYVWQALDALGWQSTESEPITTNGLADRLGVAANRRQLFGRLLAMLAEDGLLEQTAGGWRAGTATPNEDAARIMQRLRQRYPECEAELSLLESCAGELAAVLRGDVDPLALLFPDGSAERLEKLYRDSPFARPLNALLEGALARAIEALPENVPLRILEIGAGTGAATAALLPRLPAGRCEYWFTDVSQAFTQDARRKLRRWPMVRFGVLDVEAEPGPQGFATGQFDLVIAANVLHATRDLRQSLAHIRELLVPRGGLLLLEGTRPQRWLDLIFGLADGWWRFEDRDLRPRHPLISAQQWLELLAGQGFEDAAVFPQASGDVDPPQAGIFARAAGDEHRAAWVNQHVITQSTETNTCRWLILADRGGVGQALAGSLRQAGEPCEVVFHGDTQWWKLLKDADTTGEPFKGIVHVWSLDAAASDALTAEALDETRRLGCESAIEVVQRLAAFGAEPATRVWFVTRGAQAAGDDHGLPGVAQAPLWGLGRTIAEEHPVDWGGLIDLDPALPATEAAARLRDELVSPDGEDQVVVRRGQRYVARLVRRQRQGSRHPLRLRTDGCYLISGGLGDLGLRTAQWLVELGAHHLVLLGRTPLPPRDEWEKLSTGTTRQAAQLRAITQIENQGATVFTAAVDVGDETALRRMLQQLREMGWPPVRGVVQAAGIRDAQPLCDIQPEGLAETMRAKVAGTLTLHRLLERERLDFFVCFSSASALLGSPLLASYASANAFLDAIVRQRRLAGLPGLSVNWGFWAPSGNAGQTQRIAGPGIIPQGMRSFSTQQGLTALRELLESDAVQAAVMPVDFDDWCRHHPRASAAALLTNLHATEISPATDAPQDDETEFDASPRAALRAASPEESLEILQQYLREQVGRVLRMPAGQVADDVPLNSLGIDSLMAVELRNHVQAHLGVVVPVTRLLQDPTIEQLAGLVLEQFTESNDDAADAAVPGSRGETADERLARLDELSDEEVDAMLQQMLALQEQESRSAP